MTERKANQEVDKKMSGFAGKAIVMGLLERGGELRIGMLPTRLQEDVK